MRNSYSFHSPWVKTPLTSIEFHDYLSRSQQVNQRSFLLLRDKQLVGVFNINEIVRTAFQSAYLGFYVVSSQAGKGYMSLGLRLILEKAFTDLSLHRLEANIQPQNQASISLVRNNGFRKEGFSPRYLKINERWCDHERWALTLEEWQK
ncbi:GNAT family N-acetyltransferase [Legionella tunisiensis]|uniref:GNAT family N-acetyltransferase n=1 Tax=Legionella tunisiensis TaxID=1034944 RepID=UPI0003182158|nr:GNAT family protein [Legionella tunisiensis]